MRGTIFLENAPNSYTISHSSYSECWGKKTPTYPRIKDTVSSRIDSLQKAFVDWFHLTRSHITPNHSFGSLIPATGLNAPLASQLVLVVERNYERLPHIY